MVKRMVEGIEIETSSGTSSPTLACPMPKNSRSNPVW